MVFKEALKDQGVSSSWKWEDANRVIIHDPRVKALKSISERKQAFNDYITDIKNKERNDARNRRQQVKTMIFHIITIAKRRLLRAFKRLEAPP